MLKPGDPCPCCGQPIKTAGPLLLAILTRIRDEVPTTIDTEVAKECTPYIIRFSLAKEYDDNLMELPSLWRLLLWLVRNAHSCRMIHILRFVKGGQK